jgi:hypothetical protein
MPSPRQGTFKIDCSSEGKPRINLRKKSRRQRGGSAPSRPGGSAAGQARAKAPVTRGRGGCWGAAARWGGWGVRPARAQARRRRRAIWAETLCGGFGRGDARNGDGFCLCATCTWRADPKATVANWARLYVHVSQTIKPPRGVFLPVCKTLMCQTDGFVVQEIK